LGHSKCLVSDGCVAVTCEKTKGFAMLVGVLSDTHGKLPVTAYTALADCDHIIHAGDIGGVEILRELETLASVTAVLGNNDYPEYGDAVGRFANPVLGGVKFLVAHYDHMVKVTAFGNRFLKPGDPIPDVCIHGHTHVPRLDFGPDVRPVGYVLNPGSTSRPRGGFPPSIARIHIENARVCSIQVESLTGEVLLSC